MRTEGGERTNDEDNNSFFSATSIYAAAFGQPVIGVKRMDAEQVKQWLTKQKFLSSVATLGHLDRRALCQLSQQYFYILETCICGDLCFSGELYLCLYCICRLHNQP